MNALAPTPRRRSSLCLFVVTVAVVASIVLFFPGLWRPATSEAVEQVLLEQPESVEQLNKELSRRFRKARAVSVLYTYKAGGGPEVRAKREEIVWYGEAHNLNDVGAKAIHCYGDFNDALGGESRGQDVVYWVFSVGTEADDRIVGWWKDDRR